MRARGPSDIWANEAFARLSSDAKLVFLWSWSVADDAGRLILSVRKAAVHIFWGTTIPENDTVSDLFDEITLSGLWLKYESSAGVLYAQLRGWLKYGKVRKAAPSTLPGPSKEEIERYTEEHGTLDVGRSNKAESGITREDLDRVFSEWKEITNQGSRIRFTNDRIRAVKARLLEGITADEIIDACRGVMNNDWYVSKGLTDLAWICKKGSRVQSFASGGNGYDDSDDEIRDLIRQQAAAVSSGGGRRRRRLSEVV